jgi:mannose-1-phosphate guanylyltransferase
MKRFTAVIMAGGKGQRFWPLSTSDKPKQFLDLERSGRTLLQSTFDRLLPLVQSPNDIFIATTQKYVELVREQLPTVPSGNLIIEPEARDSAAAVAYASLTVHERNPETIVGFFSSDHRIGDVAKFQDTVRQAVRLATTTQGLITIGITPDRPATGYGYIQASEAVPLDEGKQSENQQGGFRVAKFIEKPNLARAQRYLEAGNYFWNAGIFVWSTKAILGELNTYAPELMQPLQEAFHSKRITEVFPTLKKISIDYAVMEHSQKVYVIPGDFEWDDIGDWVALERLLQSEEQHNTVVGTHVGLETSNNIIYTENPEDVIVTLGVENLVIVKQGHTVFLVHKDRVQDIKKLLEDERLAELTTV